MHVGRLVPLHVWTLCAQREGGTGRRRAARHSLLCCEQRVAVAMHAARAPPGLFTSTCTCRARGAEVFAVRRLAAELKQAPRTLGCLWRGGTVSIDSKRVLQTL